MVLVHDISAEWYDSFRVWGLPIDGSADLLITDTTTNDYMNLVKQLKFKVILHIFYYNRDAQHFRRKMEDQLNDLGYFTMFYINDTLKFKVLIASTDFELMYKVHGHLIKAEIKSYVQFINVLKQVVHVINSQ